MINKILNIIYIEENINTKSKQENKFWQDNSTYYWVKIFEKMNLKANDKNFFKLSN